MYRLYVVPCGMPMLDQWNVPQGMLYYCGIVKALLDLLGPYCVNRLIYMPCLMSSWHDNPTISLYIVVTMCMLF